VRVALLGRSQLALRSGEALLSAGHEIALVATAKPAEYYKAGPDEFRAFAGTAGAPFWFSPALRHPDVVARLAAVEPEVAVSVNWPTIIGREAIAVFRHGILNAHAGDLPRYRGNACPNWAILNGEETIGLCIHQMEPDEVDSGPVLLRDRLRLEPTTYIGDVLEWLERRIPELFLCAVAGLETGQLVPDRSRMDPAASLRCYPRRPEDARIDWRHPAVLVHRLVRASSRPFAGAFSFLEGERRVTIWRAEIYPHPGAFLAVPGQVLMRADGDPVIACGDGCLRLTEMAVDGADSDGAARQIVGASLRQRLV